MKRLATPLIIVALPILTLIGLMTAGGVNEFSYETAQSRYQYRVFWIPFHSQKYDTWITPELVSNQPHQWHKITAVDHGKHKYTTAGMIASMIDALDEFLSESAVEEEARPIVAAWIIEQLDLARTDPGLARKRLGRASKMDREWIVNDESEIQHMTIDELISFLDVCNRTN